MIADIFAGIFGFLLELLAGISFGGSTRKKPAESADGQEPRQ